MTSSNTFESQPESLDAERAGIAPVLAVALEAWSELGLEIGEAAVVTGSGTLARLLAFVAGMRGATPVVHWSVDPGSGGRDRTSDDAAFVDHIRRAASSRPGLAAIDVGGNPKQIDVVLDAAPRFGRVLLAAGSMPPLTIDYYSNVHRKGVILKCRRLEPAAGVVDPVPAVTTGLARARRILRNEHLAAQCMGALAGT